MKKSVSVIVPAYNEEHNLALAVKSVKTALRLIPDHEIIIVNDGSRDKTAEVAAGLAKKDKRVRIITHGKNLGIGIALREGIKAAKKEYVTVFHGDNDTSGDSMKLLFRDLGKADFISAYTANQEARPLGRQIISKVFVIGMNALFGLHMKYYTGYFICNTKRLKSLPLTARGFAFYPEAKVRLIKAGATYKEVPFLHTGRLFGSSKAISLKSLWETLRTITVLFSDVTFRRIRGTEVSEVRQKYSHATRT